MHTHTHTHPQEVPTEQVLGAIRTQLREEVEVQVTRLIREVEEVTRQEVIQGPPASTP